MTVITRRSMRRLSTSPEGGAPAFAVAGAESGTSVEWPHAWHCTNSPGGDVDCATTFVRALPHLPQARSRWVEEPVSTVIGACPNPAPARAPGKCQCVKHLLRQRARRPRAACASTDH